MSGGRSIRAVTTIVAGILALGAATAFPQSSKSGDRAAGGDFPNRPVRWIVAIAPGGSNDLIARLLAPRLADVFGQQFVVDNRAGGGGSIGAELVARANPDGHTLLFANPGPSLNNILLKKNPTYVFSDFAPVIFLGYAPLIIVASPAFPPNSAAELVAYAKANPGKVSWGSSGNGSSLHVGLASFQSATGIDIVHVPYKGAVPAMTDVMAGQINLTHTTAIAGDQFIRAGRLKVLGVASPKRQSILPKVPTLGEQGIADADSLVWFGVVAPARTPAAIVNRLNTEIGRILAAADIRQQLESMGVVVEGGEPRAFGQFIKVEAERLAKLIKEKRILPLD